MNEKKVTVIIISGAETYEAKIAIASETTTRVLRGQTRFRNMRVSLEEGAPPISQGQDLFPLVEDGGKLYANVTPWTGRKASDDSFFEELTKIFVGAGTDTASDVAEKHDLYLAGLVT